jgi:hypothetical protein
MKPSPGVTFSLRSLMLAVAIVAVVGAVLTTRESVLIGIAVFLLLAYHLSLLVPLRIRAILSAVAVSLCLLPWLGATDWAFCYPRSQWNFPSVYWPADSGVLQMLRLVLEALYWVAEFPVYLIGAYSNSCGALFFFERSDTIRPFFVFYLWLAVGLVLGVSVSTKWYRNRRSRRQGERKTEKAV